MTGELGSPDRTHPPAPVFVIVAALVIAGLLVGVLVPTPASAQAQVDTDVVPVGSQVREALEAGESVHVVVGVARGIDDQATRHMAETARVRREAVAELLGDRARGASFTSIAAVTATLTTVEDLEELLADPTVSSVEVATTRATLFNVETQQVTGGRLSHAGGLDGTGATVAIIDSGIEANHPDLRDALSHEACFMTDRSTNSGFCPGNVRFASGPGTAADDSRGHGTSVAGVISSSGSVAPQGMAPGAKLEAYKIFDNNTGGLYLDLLYVLDYILTNRPDVDVVNMSLGFQDDHSGACDADHDTLKRVIDSLNRRGTVVVASSGNRGTALMGAPACLSNVISVASTAANSQAAHGIEIAGYSDVSPVTDVAAPGTYVLTTAVGSGQVRRSGTSFASPAVAGCVALMVESGLSGHDELRDRVLNSGLVLASSNGRKSLPVIDCAVGTRIRGDVDCSGRVSIVDALQVALFASQIRRETDDLCAADPTTHINTYVADVDRNGKANIIDALVLAHCSMQVVRPECPNP